MSNYGADKMGYPVTSLEALKRRQGFPVGGPRRPAEDNGETGMGFTLAEYSQAVGENLIFDMGRSKPQGSA